MLIYLLFCLLSGKAYVGQTIHTLDWRWKQHCYEAKRGCEFHLHRAIRKYGADAFERKILATASTIDELNALEEHYIASQNTLVPNGYNLTTGGANRIPTAEVIAKISATQKGNKFASGHTVSVEHRAKIAAANKRRAGYKHSEETRLKISAATFGKKKGNKGINPL